MTTIGNLVRWITYQIFYFDLLFLSKSGLSIHFIHRFVQYII